MAPQMMEAVKIVSLGKAEVQTVPLPQLRDDYILVKVSAIALNPTDWKHIDYEVLSTPGTTVGCDFTGTVVEVGPKCTKRYKPGDRIAGVTHGSNGSGHEDGCFGEYCMVREGVSLKVPGNMSDEAAAAIGVGVVTLSIALYQGLNAPMPGSGKTAEHEWMLIYGGSSATGSLAIQSAKLSGYRVITTCSPHNFQFVKSLGAEAAFDYNDADCVRKIKELTDDKLHLALDCISEGSSPEICTAAFSSAGGKIAYLLPVEHTREGIENFPVFAYTAIGEPFHKFGQDVPAKPEDYKIASEFFAVAEKLFAEGKLKPHPQSIQDGGLQGVFDGFQMMREGKVSGQKLVYRVS